MVESLRLLGKGHKRAGHVRQWGLDLGTKGGGNGHFGHGNPALKAKDTGFTAVELCRHGREKASNGTQKCNLTFLI